MSLATTQQKQDLLTAQLNCSSGDIPTCITILDASRHAVQDPVISNTYVTLPLGTYFVQFQLGQQVKEYSLTLDEPLATRQVRSCGDWHPYISVPSPSHLSEQKELELEKLQQPDSSHPALQQKQSQLLIILHDPDNLRFSWKQPIRLEKSDGTLVALIFPKKEYKEVPILMDHWNSEAGHYQISVPCSEHQRYKLSITLISGWQTQLFLNVANREATLLTHASLGMSRLGKIFHPSDHELLLTESLHALLRSHCSEPIQVAQDGFWSHFSNPLVGLLSAWLLLQSPQKNLALLTKMIIRLKQTAGWIPDVQALAWGIRMHEGLENASKGWRKELLALPPLDEAPVLIVSAKTLLSAQEYFENIMTERLENQLRHTLYQEQGVWLVRLEDSE